MQYHDPVLYIGLLNKEIIGYFYYGYRAKLKVNHESYESDHDIKLAIPTLYLPQHPPSGTLVSTACHLEALTLSLLNCIRFF